MVCIALYMIWFLYKNKVSCGSSRFIVTFPGNSCVSVECNINRVGIKGGHSYISITGHVFHKQEKGRKWVSIKRTSHGEGGVNKFFKMFSVILKHSSSFLYLLGSLVLTFYLIIVKPLDLKRRTVYEFHKKQNNYQDTYLSRHIIPIDNHDTLGI